MPTLSYPCQKALLKPLPFRTRKLLAARNASLCAADKSVAYGQLRDVTLTYFVPHTVRIEIDRFSTEIQSRDDGGVEVSFQCPHDVPIAASPPVTVHGLRFDEAVGRYLKYVFERAGTSIESLTMSALPVDFSSFGSLVRAKIVQFTTPSQPAGSLLHTIPIDQKSWLDKCLETETVRKSAILGIAAPGFDIESLRFLKCHTLNVFNIPFHNCLNAYIRGLLRIPVPIGFTMNYAREGSDLRVLADELLDLQPTIDQRRNILFIDSHVGERQIHISANRARPFEFPNTFCVKVVEKTRIISASRQSAREPNNFQGS